MKIGNRLALQFTVIFAVVILCVLSITYFMARDYTLKVFFTRLDERTFIASQYFLEKDELSQATYEPYIAKFQQSLHQEIIQIYDIKNKNQFIDKNPDLNLSADTLNLIRSRNILRFTRGERQFVGILYRDNQGDFDIVVSAVDAEGKAKLKDLLLIMTICFLASLFIIYFLGKSFSKKALSPISHIVNQVKKITASNLNVRIAEQKSKDELNELATTFNDMLSRLELSFELQKNFLTNSSHELRTPITAAISEIEVMLSRDRSSEEYKSSLSSMLYEFNTLKEIINNLLDLALVNSDTSIIDFTNVRIDELLWDVREGILKANPAAIINIKYLNLPDDQAQLVIKGNEKLLKIAFTNIMQNACKFSDNKEVICEMISDRENDKILINVIDKGIGIPEKDIKNIYQIFYRSDNALSFSGHGIGLALTEKIIRMHGGTISATSKLNAGTTIAITLPLV